MTEQRIEPHKVTKPIQLLAAWLVGLVLTNASFLVAATHSSLGGWERGALVVAAIVNVPIFLLALFLLQTRFRAELQEDTFYADYLSKKTSMVIRLDKNAVQDEKIEELERSLAKITKGADGEVSSPLLPTVDGPTRELDWTDWPVALNHLHPRFSEVRESLRSANIPLASIFGDSGDAPSHWVVSMSYSLPVTHKAHLLRAILPFGFDGIQFWRPNRDADEDEDVYIGSYGNDGFAKITGDLSRLLDTAVEAADLNHYYKQHRIRLPKPRKEA